MSDFGKLNFSVSLNPTSAFPLDARCHFTSLEAAQIAAAQAGEVGSTNTVYYFGQRLLVTENEVDTWYTIERPGVLVVNDKTATDEEVKDLINDIFGESAVNE